MQHTIYARKIIVSYSATPTYSTADPGAGCPSDSVGIIGGVLGVLVATLLAYSVIATVVIIRLMHRNRHSQVSINQPVSVG